MQIEMRKSQHQFKNETKTSLTNQAAQLRNLEVQMGRLASLFNERQQDNLPSTSEVNPRREGKEHCKAIILRSGKTVEAAIHAHKDNRNSIEEDDKDGENFCAR